MTTPPSDTPRAAPAWNPLDARQRRVLGVLIEKAKTTPAGYPMSVLAIVAGCNFCPSCHARRLAEWSLWLDERLLAAVQAPAGVLPL